MIVSLASVPLEVRTDAAVELITAGVVEPYEALEALIYGDTEYHSGNGDGHGGYCKHGHAWTPGNTYVGPNGHRKCRTCNNASRKRTQNEYVPCAFCGGPARRRSPKADVPRCWECYTRQVREEVAA